MISRDELVALLNSYRWAKRDVEALTREIESLRERKSSATFTQEEGPRPTAPKDMSDYIVTLEALEERLEVLQLKELKTLQKVDKLVWGMPEGRNRTVLALRYLECLPWHEIADRLHYAKRSLFRIHEDALEECCHTMSPDFALL